jgi:iron complex transport system permease protein
MKQRLLFPALSLVLLADVAYSMTLGKYPLALRDIINFSLFKVFHAGKVSPENYQLFANLLMDIRLPRITAAMLIGASLAVAGTSFQAMFVNPLVSPSLLGVLAGASFGATLGMVFSKSWVAVQVFTFLFGFAAVLVADVSRMLFNVEIPIGITTSLIGIPFFVIILRKAKRGWS